MSFQWFSVTLCYYGLSFASTGLSENVWTNYLLRNCEINTLQHSLVPVRNLFTWEHFIHLLQAWKYFDWYKIFWQVEEESYDQQCLVSPWRSPAMSSVCWPSTSWAGDQSCLSARWDQATSQLSLSDFSSDHLRPRLYRLRLPPVLQQQQQHHQHPQPPPLSPGKVWSLGSIRHRLPLHGWAVPHLHEEPGSWPLCPHG